MAARVIQEDDGWEDTGDVWVDEPVNEPVVDEPSMMSKSWEAINKPLIDLAPAANKIADYVDTPELDDSGFTARLKGFGAGAIQGLGDVISSFTSPLELGLAAATGGSSFAAKRGLGTLSKGLAATGTALSAAEGLHGGGEVVGGLAEGNLPRAGLGVAEIAGGILGGKENVGAFKRLVPELPTPNRVSSSPDSNIPKHVEPVVSKVEVTAPEADWVDIDSTVDSMVDEALVNQPKPVAAQPAPVEKPKPKIKVKLNPETNSLEPDLSDELTAKVMQSAKTGEPIPDGQRLNPDDEIDLDEAFAMADAKQPEMLAARIPNDVYVNPKTNKPIDFREARNLEKLEQSEFDDILTPKDLNKREIARQIAGIPRAIQSAMDLSFPFRQGLGLAHTKGWRNAWGAMVKGMGSQKAYDTVMDSVRLDPNYKLAEEAGISFTDLATKREEELGSALAGKIPVLGGAVKFSNRGYNAFANKLRMDVFSDLIRKNPSAKNNLVEARAFADFVNNASGRGNLGRAEKSAELLNDLFFSPRLMASRVQMMNPMNYQFLRTPLQREYLKSAATVAGTWMTVAGLAKQAGADVTFDPENSDFGQIKFNGKTRIDLSGGFRPFLNLFYRLGKGGAQTVLKGKSDRYSKTPFTTAGSDFGNFLENKESPLARVALSPWQADKNRPFEAGDQALRLITPIIVQRASEIIQEDPSMWWILGPEFVGMGTNTYEKGKKPSRFLPESVFPRKSDFSFPR